MIYKSKFPSRRPKDRFVEIEDKIENSFDSSYITKKLDASGKRTAEIYVSFDYVKLLRSVSGLPEQVFQNTVSKSIRNFKMIDDKIGNMKEGLLRYELDIRIADRSKDFIREKMKLVQSAIKSVKNNPEASVNLLYDVLESDFLDNFFIDELTLRQMRVKNYDLDSFDSAKFDQKVATIKESSQFEVESDKLIMEFDKPVKAEGPVLSFTRQQALDTYALEATPVERVEQLEKILQGLQTRLSNLLGREENSQAGVSYSRRAGSVSSPRANKLTIKLDQVLDVSDYPKKDNRFYGFGTDQKIEQEFDYALVGQVAEKKQNLETAGDRVLEVLDNADVKYVIAPKNEKIVDASSALASGVKKFLSSVLEEKKVEVEYEQEYLSGYTDAVMKNPVWISLAELPEEDRGKELLFRKKPKSSSNEVFIAEEFYVKKV